MSGTDEGSSGERSLARDLLVLLGHKQRTYLAFLRARTRSDADAEELLQQALLKAATKIDTLRARDRLDAWFYRILRRTVADDVARRVVEEKHVDQLRVELETGTHEQVATCACSLGLLEGMRPEYREMLRRVDIDEEAIADVAAALGMTPNNATVRLHRARANLRAELLRLCNTQSVAACATCNCDSAHAPLAKG